MKFFALILTYLTLYNVCQAQSPNNQTEDNQNENKYLNAIFLLEVNQAGSRFVANLDEQKYSDCWLAGDPLFHRAISEEEWAVALKSCRKKVGYNQGRTLSKIVAYQNPPAMPEGQYMLLKYQSVFTNNPRCQEILTMRKVAGWPWCVVGYHLSDQKSGLTGTSAKL